jgi:hypothetical protein
MKLGRRIRFIGRRWFWAVALWLDGRLYSGPAWKHTGTKCSASEAWELSWDIADNLQVIDMLRRPASEKPRTTWTRKP